MKTIRLRPVSFVLLFLLALLVWMPLWMLVTGALTPTDELRTHLPGVLGASAELASWNLLPNRVTLRHVVELLLDTPAFFRVFWNSCVQVFPAVLGQILVGAPAAWALSQMCFRGRNALFRLYIVLMILPFQVTMVSSYIVLDRLGLVDTPFAVLLPAAFSAFPVFIMTKFFAGIPREMLEAARMDGAGEWSIFFRIGLPLGLPGVLSAALLGFVEGWNAVEQPITFLKTPSMYPLSIFLPATTVENAGVSFVSAVITLLPAVLIFLFGQQYLEQGIIASGIKE
ncbi:MAG TPA: carbohydrate ABC transporter permease, partial [Clostridia bacterium]|nr:carbohydrate ABC transporter permease [Clostridia bacterium]